jgi:hypothetical protein
MILADVATKSHAEFQNWADFELGFWHPFGSHGRESPEDIISRKRSETDKNGWTLWSFQYRRPEALDECIASCRLRSHADQSLCFVQWVILQWIQTGRGL